MQWKTSPSFPCYEVSEYGEVRRIARGIRGGNVGKIMKPYIREDGYRMYILRHDNKSFHKKAHQLVAEAFIGRKPIGKTEVCHADGTRTNDHYSNLSWGTSKDNKADMLKHGTRIFGSKIPWAKLNEEKVVMILDMAAQGIGQRIIGERFGVLQTAVSRIVSRKRWRHVQWPR